MGGWVDGEGEDGWNEVLWVLGGWVDRGGEGGLNEVLESMSWLVGWVEEEKAA